MVSNGKFIVIACFLMIVFPLTLNRNIPIQAFNRAEYQDIP